MHLIMKRFSLSNGKPLDAEEGQEVVCVVPYAEHLYGFDAGEEIRVLTSAGERRATVLQNTQVHPLDAVPEKEAVQAGFANAREVAERYRSTERSLVAVVRFQVHEVITRKTLFDVIRKTFGW